MTPTAEKRFNLAFNIFLVAGMFVAVTITTVFKLQQPGVKTFMLLLAAFGSLMGVVNTVLSANGHILTFVFGFLDVLAATLVYLDNGIMGNFALHALYFLPMQFVGFWQWKRRGARVKSEGGEDSRVNARRLGRKQWAFLAAGVAAGILVLYLILLKVDAAKLAAGKRQKLRITADGKDFHTGELLLLTAANGGFHGGIESYWKGILSHDGEPGETYSEIRQIGQDLKRLVAAMTDEPKQNQIAMVVSPEALHALRWFPTEQGLSYNDVVNAFHRALYELNLECDVLYDRETDWSGYKLLIFPELYCASDEMIRRVRAYVEQGGSIFAGFRSFFADENLLIRHDRQPHGLSDVFGMRYDRFTKNADHAWMELLEPDTAEVIARYDDRHWQGFASLTHHRFGAGQAWYLGCTVPDQELKNIFLQAADAAGISQPTVRWPVILRRRGGLLFLMNFSDDTQTLPCPQGGADVLTGAEFMPGQDLSLPPWDAVVLREEANTDIGGKDELHREEI